MGQPLRAVNVGSGQRRFDGWINCDVACRPPLQIPDVICDARSLPFASESVDVVVLHHVLEHFHVNEAEALIHEAHRVLRQGGSLLVFTPDLRALAVRWLTGQLDDFNYTVQLYGAWQGMEGDDHHWNWSQAGLLKYVSERVAWSDVSQFNWRHIPGADFARDWYIASCEATK